MVADLKVWETFLNAHNGTSVMLQTQWEDNATLNFHTSVGFGAIFQVHWAYGTCPICWELAATNITFMELFPIVFAINLCYSGFCAYKVKRSIFF